MGLECSGVCQQSLTFWSVTLQPLEADQTIIHQMKGDIHSFHMRYSSMICSKRLQSYRTNPSLWLSSLVFAPSHLGFPLDSVERAPENKLDLLLHLVREVLHGAEVLA